jgi:hypothetical protein
MLLGVLMDTQHLAYAAGVIDSDGYIGVKRSTYQMRVTGDAGQPTYSERICVKQVETGAVYLLKELFGGTMTMGKPTAKKGRPLHTWQVTDRKAADCLLALMPYLRIKREQALNCLDLRSAKERSAVERVAYGRGHQGAARRPADISALMQRTYERGKELNAVGIR